MRRELYKAVPSSQAAVSQLQLLKRGGAGCKVQNHSSTTLALPSNQLSALTLCLLQLPMHPLV